MSQQVAGVLVAIGGAYLAIGAIFGALFVTRGAMRVDPRAAGSGWGFRLAILPASAALWPWVSRLWVRGGGAQERTAHRLAASPDEGAP